MKGPKVTREQIWQEIQEGKRKKQFFFVNANTSLVAGIFAFLGVLHLGFITGPYGFFLGLESLKDKNEKSIKTYRIRARIGIVLSAIGIIWVIIPIYTQFMNVVINYFQK